MRPALIGSTRRLLRQLENAGLLPREHRARIARGVFAAIGPHTETNDAHELRQLRRRAQDDRARLMYTGARDFSDVQFAVATLVEQWAVAKMELIAPRSNDVLAQRRCQAIEEFARRNFAR